MRGRRWIASVWLAWLAATPAAAADPCPADRYAVVEGALLAQAGAARDFVVLGSETVGVSSGCPDVGARLRARRNGVTRLRAVWGTATPCAGVPRAILTAKIVDGCSRFTGTLVAHGSKPRKRKFAAQRSTCGDGILDAGRGETCDGLEVGTCPNGCRPECTCAPLRGLFAVADGNVLVRFSSAAPETITAIALVTGLGRGESIVGIDFRPATGELYGFGMIEHFDTDTAQLYRIEPTTAVATPVGDPLTVTHGDAWGFAFNPLVDRIRVVNDADANLRLNPVTGAPAFDTDLNPTGARIEAIAYTGLPGDAATTLYALGYAHDTLYTVNPPNAGVLTAVGVTGILSEFNTIGFDIDGTTGAAYATVFASGVNALYTVDLATGGVTIVGTVGNGALRLPSLAIAPGGPVL